MLTHVKNKNNSINTFESSANMWRSEADCQRSAAIMLWGEIKRLKREYDLGFDLNSIFANYMRLLDGEQLVDTEGGAN